MSGFRLGIDVGGTKCLGIVLSSTGEVVTALKRPTPRGDGSLPMLITTLTEMVTAFEAECGTIDTVGVGMPGLVTHDGVLRASPNLDGVADFDVAGELSSAIRQPVKVGNDATCGALAEWKLGAASGTRDMMLVTLGTGIGGGVVAGGKLQQGAHGFAGEYCHMVVDPDGASMPMWSSRMLGALCVWKWARTPCA